MKPVVHFGVVDGPPWRLMASCGSAPEELVSFVYNERVNCGECRRIHEEAVREWEERTAADRAARIAKDRRNRDWRKWAPQIWVARANGARPSECARHWKITQAQAHYLDAKVQAAVDRQWKRLLASQQTRSSP